MLSAVLVILMYEVNGNACDLFICLLGMCEFMGSHIYIALVDLDCGYE